MSVHFLLQTNGFKQSISFEDLVHLQVFFTTCRHCGQSPGWHFSGQLWPQSSFFSQVLWHRGASSVQGRPLGAGVFPHGHVFLCARGHSPQSPGQQIFSQLWWPLIPRTTLIMRQAQQSKHTTLAKKKQERVLARSWHPSDGPISTCTFRFFRGWVLQLTATKQFTARFAARPSRCSTRYDFGLFAAGAGLKTSLWTFQAFAVVADLFAPMRAAREQLVARFAARPMLIAAPFH